MPRISTVSRQPAQKGHPENCDCCKAATPAQQNLEELAFLKSACAAAKAGNIEKLRRCIEKQPSSLHSDGSGGAVPATLSAQPCHVVPCAETRCAGSGFAL